MLLSPHADDECLFAFYTMMRLEADVLLCLNDDPARELEFHAAMDVAGRTRSVLNASDSEPDWNDVRWQIECAASLYDVLIAPAYESGGHEQHNRIALIVNELGHPNVERYLTYRRGHGRSIGGTNVTSDDPGLRDLKLEALQCYVSQWENPATSPWFPGGIYGTYMEWTT